MIESHTEGRLRLRDRSLRDADELRAVTTRLVGLPGVVCVAGNATTGGVLIEYDPSAVTHDAIVEASGLTVEKGASVRTPILTPRARARRMRTAKQGMLVSLGALLLFALAKRERLHVVAGLGFLSFNAYHVYTYRNRVLK